MFGTVAAAVLVSTAAGGARAEDEGFTPIPVIQGMKLLPQGTDAPVFKVKDITGQEFDFAEAKNGKAHVMVFWSIFCEPCREEMPIIEQIHAEFKDKNLEVLAVNLDGEPFLEGIKGYINQYKYSFRVVLDELVEEDFKIADPYQVAGTPVLYLVDDTGKIYANHLGRMTVKDLRELINQMLGEG
jgi:thiol-disulfide isomerase/thioredoxin